MTTVMAATIPAHVPPHLVIRWDPMAAPGADVDPYAANGYVFDGPDIFYSPAEKPGEENCWIVTRYELIREMFLIFVAGLDTVASTLGFMFRHLAMHPALQDRLRREPAKIPDALEEIMRAHGIVDSPRYVTRDLDFDGVRLATGDRVILAQTVACRDPSFYDRPGEIDIDRQDIMHMIFAAGPHRCMGSHLARREMTIALEEWLARAPRFIPDPDRRATAQAGAVWGMNALPLIWAL